MRNPTGKNGASLLRMLGKQGQSCLFPVALLMGLGLLGAGGVMLVWPFIGKREALSLEDLSISVFGCAAIAVGTLLLLNATIFQLAREISLHLDEECPRAQAEKGLAEQEVARPECRDLGLSRQSTAKSWLRQVSTRDLSVGWLFLVVVPLAVGVVLLLFAILAWQVPRLGQALALGGLRLDYLCLGGIVLMMIGASIMPLGIIVCKRRQNGNRRAL